MKPTTYPHINSLLNELFLRIQEVFGNKLVGLYLEGSLVFGDFNEKISDIDLLAVLSSDVTDQEFVQIKKMHEDFVKKHPKWDDEIEVCYISTNALMSIKSRTSPIVNISPGEPIHKMESSKEWIMNWYLAREKSATLFGPSLKTIIEPISKEEYIQSVKDHVKSWSEWVKHMKDRYAQVAYTVLTMCRALYAVRNGDQVSKKQAARWVQGEFPEWSDLIADALVWRETKNEERPSEEVCVKMTEFVNFVRGEILE